MRQKDWNPKTFVFMYYCSLEINPPHPFRGYLLTWLVERKISKIRKLVNNGTYTASDFPLTMWLLRKLFWFSLAFLKLLSTSFSSGGDDNFLVPFQILFALFVLKMINVILVSYIQLHTFFSRNYVNRKWRLPTAHDARTDILIDVKSRTSKGQ